jgi:hypothetical protein
MGPGAEERPPLDTLPSNAVETVTENSAVVLRAELNPEYFVGNFTTLSVAKLYNVEWRDDKLITNWKGLGRKRL